MPPQVAHAAQRDLSLPHDDAEEHGTETPGVPGEEETSTGNPDAAGAAE